MRVLFGFLYIVVVFTIFIGCKSADVVKVVEQSKHEKKVLPIQKKYAPIIGVTPEQINAELFQFIEKWIEAPYTLGGETKNGIDCSYFTQFLYHDVYNNLIERTAEKQYTANDTDKFLGQEYLKEGDLLFFNQYGSQHHKITHVGMYLGFDKFVHSTSRSDENGKNGVQISDFKDQHWQKMFVAAGRKPINSENSLTQDN